MAAEEASNIPRNQHRTLGRMRRPRSPHEKGRSGAVGLVKNVRILKLGNHRSLFCAQTNRGRSEPALPHRSRPGA